jgi:calpain-7
VNGIKSDPSEFSLSPEQKVIFDGWKRPSELVPGTQKAGGSDDHVDEEQDPDHLMIAKSEIDLAQDLATDCSVVASLCAAARHFTSAKGSVSSILPTYLLRIQG